MNKVTDFTEMGKELERMLKLRTHPIALKMVTKDDALPEKVIRPKEDGLGHIALCQGFFMARKQGWTLYMEKEDHWCWAPLIAYGMVEFHEDAPSFGEVVKNLGIADMEQAKAFAKKFPKLEYEKYTGILMGPLSSATYEPDVVLIYSNPGQLRTMLWAYKNQTGDILKTEMDGIDSCVFSAIPILKGGKARVTVPDPGEYERANATEDEMIFSISKEELPLLIQGLQVFDERKMGYGALTPEIRPDYPRPQFYNNLFEIWGLDTGEVWKR
ncbi:DUF169 domain-containing protein [Alkalibacter rhizosphaerae]|uniref:DUF169 domain-containing protein n=1 Tax=Alkalibacter rhizosphaerae TaxID=2815577 RepID=A0A975AHC6_9FIRM|nr:DUF169 domain-containing protein [Alkalibacter rhizosphaerae]QSX07868.1 DUF169 domain-containing protein [Alkalibacter rhizosphaerae]